MNDSRAKKDSVEVSSDQLQEELAAIKERLNAIETIQTISNVTVVKKYVEEHLTTTKAKDIMRECEEPRTSAYLIEEFGFSSRQALNYHLTPLREADLLRPKTNEEGKIVFEWSNLFRRLPKTTIRSILGAGK